MKTPPYEVCLCLRPTRTCRSQCSYYRMTILVCCAWGLCVLDAGDTSFGRKRPTATPHPAGGAASRFFTVVQYYIYKKYHSNLDVVALLLYHNTTTTLGQQYY